MNSRPTREQWIALRIEAAMVALAKLTECPDCHRRDMHESVTKREAFGYFETRVTHCTHPWHLVPLCGGDPWLLAIGLPNEPNIPHLNVKDMQERALEYALRERLLVEGA